MKKDSPRRKIADAVDFLIDDANEHSVPEISIRDIKEFSDHPFHLYEGQRLEDMVESIKANGVLTPVIIRSLGPSQYEMLAGHNRMNAAKMAGLNTIPAIIKENLTDEEAYIYVIETNLMQRSFNDLYPSEKAAVLAVQHDKVSSQGKRTDILKEIKALENGEVTDIEEVITDSRGRLAKEYGLSGRTVARLLRINKLTDDWKLDVDNEKIGLMTGVEISYITKKLQKHLYKECTDLSKKLSLKDAQELKILHKSGELNETLLTKFLIDKEKKKIQEKAYHNVKVSSMIMNKYFVECSAKEVEETIDKALKQYFKK